MASITDRPGFVPPPYPYDRLDRFKPLADRLDGGLVDLSIGTPIDPPPRAVDRRPRLVGRRARLPAEHRLARAPRPPRSGGSTGASTSTCPSPRSARASAPRSSSGRCRSGCGCAVPIATPCSTRRCRTRRTRWGRSWPAAGRCRCRRRRRLARPRRDRSRRRRPGAGAVGQQPEQPDRRARRPVAAAAWGRSHGVPVFSDECYVEFTWTGRGRTILEHGLDGVVAVHSLSKRSNLAGCQDRLLRRRRRARPLPPGGPQARRDDGARPGAGGRCRGPRRRRPRRRPARPLPAPPRAAGRRPRSLVGVRDRAARRRLLPVVRRR